MLRGRRLGQRSLSLLDEAANDLAGREDVVDDIHGLTSPERGVADVPVEVPVEGLLVEI